jgi:hypothetical protein
MVARKWKWPSLKWLWPSLKRETQVSLLHEEKKTSADEHLLNRSNELARVDASWRAWFDSLCCFGCKSARQSAGFTEIEIFDIDQYRKEVRKKQLESRSYLQIRAVSLQHVDRSWAATFFKNYARKKAGFKDDEIAAIEKMQDGFFPKPPRALSQIGRAVAREQIKRKARFQITSTRSLEP